MKCVEDTPDEGENVVPCVVEKPEPVKDNATIKILQEKFPDAKVVHLWDNKYRVNVYTTIPQENFIVVSYKITQSYFVCAFADSFSYDPPLI